jgi:hypothetical protein
MKLCHALRSGSLSVLIAAGLLVSCTDSTSGSGTKDVSGTVSFSDYCSEHGLSNCDASASDVPATQKQWEVNIDLFKEVLNSPSTIRLSRDTFNLNSVKRLFSTFGASGLMSFVNRVPWTSLYTDVDSIVLTSEAERSEVEVNGLKIIGSSEVKLKVGRGRVFSVSGLSIADASGENEQAVKSIDLGTAGVVHLNLEGGRLSDVPISFFAMNELVTQAAPTAAEIFQVVADLVMDPGFDWRNNANIILAGRNVKSIIALANQLIPDQNAFGKAMDSVMNNTSQAVFGGDGVNVLSVSLNSAMECKMNFVGLPIIGTATVDMSFAQGFGLSELKELPSGALAARIYGIKTSLGAVQSVEFKNQVMSVKVGMFTLPIDLKAQAQGGGASLKSMTCE